MHHCAACGEGVESYEVDLGGMTEIRCLRCGLPLEKTAETLNARFRTVLVADDSEFFTRALRDVLVERKLARQVLLAADGAEALHLATSCLRDGRGPELTILDLLMPRLNGFHAAVALRAVERAFGGARTRILFLSSRRIDPALQPILKDLTPAYYLNKGSDSRGERLWKRVEEVVRVIADSTRRGGSKGGAAGQDSS